MRRLTALVIALAALAVAPAAAQASLLKVTAGTLFYVDTDPGAANVVTVKASTDGSSLVVTDSGRSGGKAITITSDGSCTGGRGTGSCPASGVSAVDVETGDQADTIKLTVALPGRLDGGAGGDHLTGGSGNDTLIGGTGADTLAGGAGTDTGDYSARSAPVTVTLDGKADDGEAGEADNVATDVENVVGGAGDDNLTGSSADNVLAGGGGNDTLSGGDGNDQLQGAAGDDHLDGAGGDDSLTGDDGNDTLTGGAGNDQLHAGSGDDQLDGGTGDDVVAGEDGNDSLTGGDGNDQVDGGAGDDTVAGGLGADALIGGDGTDTATYAAAGGGVGVSLNGKPDDGAAGEGDNVDTENVTGSPGDDTLVGNGRTNVLQGGAGDDHLVGGKGADTLDGGEGDDLLMSLDGGKDRVICADGADGTVGDRRDVRSDCEQIKYRALAASSTRLHLSRGSVRVPVRCAPGSATGCAGRIAVEYRRRALGTLTFRLTVGRRWVAHIRLSRRGAALVAAHSPLTASLVVRDRDASGLVTKTRQTIRIAR